MKAIIKFLLRTDAGKFIVQTIVALVIKAAKKRISRLPPEKRTDVYITLDLVHAELHDDVSEITVDL